MVESHKLDPRPLNEDPRPIEAKLRWHQHGTILEGNSIGPDQKMELKGELMVWRTKIYKLGSKVVYSIVFHHFTNFSRFFFPLVLEVEIVQEWKTFHGWRRTLWNAHPSFHF